MIFNSGITVRAAELDENIIFGETADDSTFQESNEDINDNQDQIPEGSSDTLFFEEGSDSNSQSDQNASDSNNNSASDSALDEESLDSLDSEISDNPESKEVTEDLPDEEELFAEYVKCEFGVDY